MTQSRKRNVPQIEDKESVDEEELPKTNNCRSIDFDEPIEDEKPKSKSLKPTKKVESDEEKQKSETKRTAKEEESEEDKLKPKVKSKGVDNSEEGKPKPKRMFEKLIHQNRRNQNRNPKK
jgi:hypothetical protein